MLKFVLGLFFVLVLTGAGLTGYRYVTGDSPICCFSDKATAHWNFSEGGMVTAELNDVPLKEALQELNKHGLQMAYNPTVLRGKRITMRASNDIKDVASMLVKAAGLTPEFQDNRTLIVRP